MVQDGQQHIFYLLAGSFSDSEQIHKVFQFFFRKVFAVSQIAKGLVAGRTVIYLGGRVNGRNIKPGGLRNPRSLII